MKILSILKIIKVSVYIIFIFFYGVFFFSLFFPAHPLVLFFYPLFGFICHQEDFLKVGEVRVPLPLCFRCSGIYLFLGFGAFMADVFSRKLDGHLSFLFLVLGTFPLILDGFFQITTHFGIPFVSFLTGVFFGGTCGVSFMYGMNGLIKKYSQKIPEKEAKNLLNSDS